MLFLTLIPLMTVLTVTFVITTATSDHDHDHDNYYDDSSASFYAYAK